MLYLVKFTVSTFFVLIFLSQILRWIVLRFNFVTFIMCFSWGKIWRDPYNKRKFIMDDSDFHWVCSGASFAERTLILNCLNFYSSLLKWEFHSFQSGFLYLSVNKRWTKMFIRHEDDAWFQFMWRPDILLWWFHILNPKFTIFLSHSKYSLISIFYDLHTSKIHDTEGKK